MKKHTVVLWTDEAVYTVSALESQLHRYSKEWRRTFIEYDRNIAHVYLVAIEATRGALKEVRKALLP